MIPPDPEVDKNQGGESSNESSSSSGSLSARGISRGAAPRSSHNKKMVSLLAPVFELSDPDSWMKSEITKPINAAANNNQDRTDFRQIFKKFRSVLLAIISHAGINIFEDDDDNPYDSNCNLLPNSRDVNDNMQRVQKTMFVNDAVEKALRESLVPNVVKIMLNRMTSTNNHRYQNHYNNYYNNYNNNSMSTVFNSQQVGYLMRMFMDFVQCSAILFSNQEYTSTDGDDTIISVIDWVGCEWMKQLDNLMTQSLYLEWDHNYRSWKSMVPSASQSPIMYTDIEETWDEFLDRLIPTVSSDMYTNDLSRSQSSFILCFIEYGGIQGMARQLEADSVKDDRKAEDISLLSVDYILIVIGIVSTFLKQNLELYETYESEMAVFKSSLLDFLKTVDVDFDHRERQHWMNILKQCEDDANEDKIFVDSVEFIRSLKLDHFWRLFKSDSLQNRIAALSEIRSCVHNAVDQYNRGKHTIKNQLNNSKTETRVSPRLSMSRWKDLNSKCYSVDEDDEDEDLIPPLESYPRIEEVSNMHELSPAGSEGGVDDNVSTVAFGPSNSDDMDMAVPGTMEIDKLSHVANTETYHRSEARNGGILHENKHGGEIAALLDWMTNDHCFIKEIMSPELLHPELLKRCAFIPLFMAEQLCLTVEHIEYVWTALLGSSHESIQNSVLEVINEVLPELSSDLLIHLNRKLKEFETAKHTPQTLYLLACLAESSVGLIDGSEPVGIGILLNLSLDLRALPRPDLYDIVLNHSLRYMERIDAGFKISIRGLEEDKRQNAIPGVKYWLFMKAIEGLREGVCCVPCQAIVTKVLRSWPVETRKDQPLDFDRFCRFERVTRCLDGQQKEARIDLVHFFGLIDLVVDNLCHYYKLAHVFIQQYDDRDSIHNGSFSIDGIYIHRVIVASHTDFLKLLYLIVYDANMHHKQNTVKDSFNAQNATPSDAIVIEDEEENEEPKTPDDKSNTEHEASEADINTEVIDRLWITLVENGMNVHDIDLFFVTYRDLLSASDVSFAFRVSLSRLFFGLLTEKQKIQTVRPTAFDLYTLSITVLNWMRKSFDLTDDNTSDSKITFQIALAERKYTVRIINFDVKGMEELWNIIMYCSNDEVVERASSILSSIYLFRNIPSTLQESVDHHQHSFISKCFQVLALTSDEVGSTEAVRRIHLRCLQLITSFSSKLLTAVSMDDLIPEEFSISHGSYTPLEIQIPRNITVKILFSSNIKGFELTCPSDISIYLLREKVKKYLVKKNLSSSTKFDLSLNGKIIDKYSNLAKGGVHEGASIKCNIKINALPVPDVIEMIDLEKTETSCQSSKLRHESKVRSCHVIETLSELRPLKMLLDPENLAIFFNMMDDTAARPLVWNLLMHLPSCPDILADLRQMEVTHSSTPPKWHLWLSQEDNLFKQLYVLQMIENIINGRSDQTADNKVMHMDLVTDEGNLPKDTFTDLNWTDRFVHRGGLGQVIGVFLSKDLSSLITTSETSRFQSHDSIGLDCIDHIQRIIYFFLSINLVDMQHVNIAKRCLEIVQMCIKLEDQVLTTNTSMYIMQKDGTPATPKSSSVLNQSLVILFLLLRMNDPLLKLLIGSNRAITQSEHSPMQKAFFDCMAASLLFSSEDSTREICLNGIISLYECTSNTYYMSSLNFLGSLLPLLDRCSEPVLFLKCRFFYEAVKFLLQHVWSNIEGSEIKVRTEIKVEEGPMSTPDQLEFGNLLLWISRSIVSQNTKVTPPLIDYSLQGSMMLADILLQMLGRGAKEVIGHFLLDHLFFDCLFCFPSGGECKEPKCRDDISRAAAYQLLLTLCTDTAMNLEKISINLLKLLDSSEPRDDIVNDWYYDVQMKNESSGYVGMKNLGCTCYLNSLFQQFFQILPFRNGIFSCDSSKVDNKPPKEENLLYQLQVLFSNLQMSERKEFDTSELVKTIKGYDGAPLSVGEQQDVDEFFGLICDRLETILKPLPQRNLLREIFGGKLCHTITCQECRRGSQREEDCLVLSLDVKGKSSVIESLDLYVDSETLDGDNKYLCEHCSEKKDSLKRCCISELPNVLLLHLKRFEFDLELMRKIKVNDKCEFPLELDMLPFTKEGLDKNNELMKHKTKGYYTYNLKGVLVHSGSADSGHYYSLCRSATQSGEQWFCFNDSSVTQFDPTMLSQAAFGGRSGNGHLSSESSKNYSAYLLVYDRKSIVISQEDPANSDSNPLFMESKDSNCFVPLDIADQLRVENERFFKDKMFLSIEFQSWLCRLTELAGTVVVPKSDKMIDLCEKHSPEVIEIDNEVGRKKNPTALTKSIVFYAFDTLMHSKNRFQYEKLLEILRTSFRHDVTSCKWILSLMSTTHIDWVAEILLRCPLPDIRKSFVQLLDIVFDILSNEESVLYNINHICKKSGTEAYEEYNSEFIPDDDDNIVIRFTTNNSLSRRLGRTEWWHSKSVLARFIGFSVLDLIVDCEKHWRRFEQVFDVLLRFSACGIDETLYLIRCCTILRLLDLYQGEKGYIPARFLVGRKREESKKRPTMGDKYASPIFSSCLKLLSTLVRSGLLANDDDDDDDDSSDVSDRPQKRIKSSTPVSSIPLPSTLTRKARNWIDSNSKIVYLPKRDTGLLTSKPFIQKLLNEASSDCRDSIIEIIKHMCYGNREVSQIVCEVCAKNIKDQKAEEFELSLDVLLSLVSIDDKVSFLGKHFNRSKYVFSSIYNGIECNLRYEKESCSILSKLRKKLLALKKQIFMNAPEYAFHELVREHFFDKKLVNWLKKQHNSSVDTRQNIINVAVSLIPDIFDDAIKPTTEYRIPLTKRSAKLKMLSSVQNEFLFTEEIREEMFSALIALFDIVYDDIRNNSTRRGSQLPGDPKLYASYFKGLRFCIRGSDFEKRHILHQSSGILKKFTALLWKIDEDGRNEYRKSADITKGEMIFLFKTLIESHDEVVEEFVFNFRSIDRSITGREEKSDREIDLTHGDGRENDSNMDATGKLLEIFVTSSKSEEEYNNRYIKHYYHLMVLLAEKSPKFKKRLLFHDNWWWALKVFVFNRGEKPLSVLAAIIWDYASKCVEENERYQTHILKQLTRETTASSSQDRNSPTTTIVSNIQLAPESLMMLYLLLCSPQREGYRSIVSTFVDANGLQHLCLGFIELFEVLSCNETNAFDVDSTIHKIKWSLKCFLTILSSLSSKGDSNDIIGRWFSLDRVHSICESLTNQNFWSKFGDDLKNVILATEVLDVASELHNILCSIVTVRKNLESGKK